MQPDHLSTEINTEPNNLEKPEKNAPKEHKKKSARVRYFSLLLAILSLMIAAVGICYLWQQLKHTQTQIDAQVEIIQNLNTQLLENKDALHTQEQVISQMQSNVQQLISQTSSLNKSNTDWVLSEAAYLIHLADFNTSVMQNIPVAIKLLAAADTRLKAISDPKVIPVRRALTQDMLALEAVKPIDTAGIILRIEAIQAAVAELSLITNNISKTSTDKNENKTGTASPNTWKQGLTDTLKDLKGLVVIRHNEEIVEPLTSIEDKTYFIRNLQLKLVLAQWALLQKQPDVYTNTLAQAITWLERYFAASTAAQTISAQLKQLQEINLLPTIPDLSASVQAVEQALNKSTANNTQSLLSPGESSQQPTKSAQPAADSTTSENSAAAPKLEATATSKAEDLRAPAITSMEI